MLYMYMYVLCVQYMFYLYMYVSTCTLFLHSTALHCIICRSFIEMLKNPDHIESFYNFLCSNGNGAEMGLVFWLSIEDLKDSIGDPNNFKIKTRRIMRRFFKEGLDISIHLSSINSSDSCAVFCSYVLQRHNIA